MTASKIYLEKTTVADIMKTAYTLAGCYRPDFWFDSMADVKASIAQCVPAAVVLHSDVDGVRVTEAERAFAERARYPIALPSGRAVESELTAKVAEAVRLHRAWNQIWAEAPDHYKQGLTTPEGRE